MSKIFTWFLDTFFARDIAKDKKAGQFDAEEEREQRKISAQEKKYHRALGGMLSKIGLTGFDAVGAPKFGLDGIYVNLNISQFGDREHFDKYGEMGREGKEKLPAEKVVNIVFHEYERDVLLISGDPGSGKTTLCAHLFDACLDKKSFREMGFKKHVIPLYFPLRDLDPQKTFSENFAAWCKDKECRL